MNILMNTKKVLSFINNQTTDLKIVLYSFAVFTLAFVICVPVSLVLSLFSASDKGTGNLINGGEIAFSGNTVYAVNPSDSKVYIVKGDTKKAVSEIRNCRNIVVDGNTLFYFGGAEYGKSGIYKTNLKTDKTELLYNGNTPLFDIYDGLLYFISSPSDGKKMSVMRLDGSRRRELSKLDVECFDISDDRILYCDKYGRLYSNDLDGKSEIGINSVLTDSFFVSGDYIYYKSEGSINRCNLDGGENTSVCTLEANNFNICNDYLIVCNDSGIFSERNGILLDGYADEVYINKNEIMTFSEEGIVSVNVKSKETRTVDFN